RQRRGQLHGLLDAARHRTPDPFSRPLGFVAEHVRRERFRLVEANASVAEVALDAFEQLLQRRVVQIHVEMIREDELHAAERVAFARALAVAPARFVRLDVVPVQIPGIAFELRQDFLLDDVLRNVPRGTEDDARHLVGQLLLPVTTFMPSTRVPSSITSRRNAGMFTVTYRRPRSAGSERQRAMFRAIVCAAPWSPRSRARASCCFSPRYGMAPGARRPSDRSISSSASAVCSASTGSLPRASTSRAYRRYAYVARRSSSVPELRRASSSATRYVDGSSPSAPAALSVRTRRSRSRVDRRPSLHSSRYPFSS